MADVDLTITQIDQDGVQPATNASLSTSDTYKARNDGRVFLQLVNGDTASHTFTIAAQKSVAGLAVPDQTISVPAGEERWAGPFAPAVFNDTNDDVNVTVDSATGTEIGAYHL